MVQFFHTLRRLLTRTPDSAKQPLPPDSIIYRKHPLFDARFKIVIEHPRDDGYYQLLEWVNSNSHGSVQMAYEADHGGERIFIAFEDPDDALFFKIKYSV